MEIEHVEDQLALAAR